MPSNLYRILCISLVIIIAILTYTVMGFKNEVTCNTNDSASLTEQRYQITQGFQTSATYLSKLAKLDACLDRDSDKKQKIHALIKDIEIKASSYAFLNKVFFWISLIFAITIIVFPIISSFTTKGSIYHKIFNPVQLPAITLLAGLCFTLYSDYKGKQTSAENLIRYSYFSGDEIKIISKTVRAALAEIDGGQNFSSLIQNEEP